MKSKERKAFTLSEALVSMVLLGIVMALTIPSFVSSFDTNQYRLKLKKSVRILNEALDTNVSRLNISPATCSGCSIFGDVGASNIAKYFAISIPVLSWDNVRKFTTPDGVSYFFAKNTASPCGTSSSITPGGGADCQVLVDVNGNKGPNVQGNSYYHDKNEFQDQYQLIIMEIGRAHV